MGYHVLIGLLLIISQKLYKIITINFYNNSYFGICYPINLKKLKFCISNLACYCY